jgi:hypothetical protein
VSRRNRARSRYGSRATVEAPQQVAGLKAWWDARTNAYMTIATGVSAWLSRAGSMGSVALSQATGGNQPAYATAVASLNGKNAVQFDGTDDFLQAATESDWIFTHDNTGATIFTVERVDSTGGADQFFISTQELLATTVGTCQRMRLASLEAVVANGSGTLQNNWVNNTAGHFARDVSRWRAWSYGGGALTSAISGSTVTNNDTGGQTPSTSAPLRALRLSRSTSPLKGYIAQVIIYNRVLSAGERAQLAAWAAAIYGVTA